MDEKAALVGYYAPWHQHLLASPGQVLAEAVAEATVDEHGLQPIQHLVAHRQRVPHPGGRRPSVATGSDHATGQQITRRVDEEKALATLDALARIIAHASRAGGRVFYALAVEDGGRGLGVFFARCRTSTVKQPLIRCHVPSAVHVVK